VQEVFDTAGVKLTAAVLDKWYDQQGLDSSLPLSVPRNKTRLPSCEMDPNKPSMFNRYSMPAPVPWDKRTEELGFPAGSAAKAKEKYRGRRGGRESASVDREPASMEALIDGTTSDQVSRADLLDFVHRGSRSPRRVLQRWLEHQLCGWGSRHTKCKRHEESRWWIWDGRATASGAMEAQGHGRGVQGPLHQISWSGQVLLSLSAP
jgi:hypothetical protein